MTVFYFILKHSGLRQMVILLKIVIEYVLYKIIY